ncbi:MAG: hypothetical protein IPK82_00490 [Polyangiaceae bacterium]|nr:hypothetical protein [Polyangiaceae bacterium]
MDIPWRPTLIVAAAAFVIFLIAKLLPRRSKRVGSASLSAAKARLRDAKTNRERADALCEAGEAAISGAFGSTRAAAYFMRAMRADPTWEGAVLRTEKALSPRRHRLLRKMMWRRLAASPWDQEHAAAVRAVATVLAHASKGVRTEAAQAEFMSRLVAGETLPFKQ